MPDASPSGADASAARHARLREIVLAADALPGAERERFVAERCAGDEALARAVRDVLGGTPVATRDLVPTAMRSAAAHAADAPPPSRLGPFRVLREIGRGGMGVVYEAEDERTGRRVALKAIRAELLGNARAEERFAREAAAGAGVDHPNVVRTLGVERVEAADGSNRCLLVTEIVAGRTLRELLSELGTVPESLVREIARGMAQGLAAIHAAGVVHRDLKPENVILTPEGRVRIMDLGVARIVDRTDGLTREGDFVGSPEYAAPEQCAGRTVGPAADLYALGVVLFELASGTNPFRRAGTLATVAAHLSEAAPPLAAHAAGTSEFLGAVVATLLAKDPTARFASAAELAAALAVGEGGAWRRTHRASHDAAAAPALRVPVARELALRGRRRELSALLDAFEEARNGHGTVVLLTGEPGLGKTRLLDLFLGSVGSASVHRAYGAVPPGGDASGIAEALLGVCGGDDAEGWLAARAGMSVPLAASFAAHLRREPPPAGVATLGGDAVVSAYLRTMKTLAAERPLVLTVDDAHQAAPETTALLRSLARGLATERVLLVIASRSDGALRWAGDLASLAGWREVALSRLSSEDVVEILRASLGSQDLAQRAARRIAAKSGGVPLYVAAMAAALRDALAAAPPGGEEAALDTIDVPMALRGALAARLAALSPDERTLLDACSVQGARFDADLAAEVLSLPRLLALQTLAGIERRLGVVRADGRAFRFDHQLLADEVVSAMPAALREEYHRRTADVLAARGAPASAPDVLAHHLLESGHPPSVRPHLLPAIDALASRHENDAALALAGRALAIDGLLAGRERAEVLLRASQTADLLGRRARQAETAGEALALARAERDLLLVSRALVEVGVHLAATGGDRRAAPRFRAALRLARRAGDPVAEVRATSGLGRALVRVGRSDEARARLLVACALAERIGDPQAEQLARRSLGLLDLSVARFDEAREMLLRCLEIVRATGDVRSQGYAEGGLGVLSVHEGEWENARERFLVALDAARTVGDRSLEVHALGSLSMVLQAVGRCVEAIAANRELRPLVESVGDRTGLALLLLNVTQAHMHLGEREAALAAMDEAAGIVAATGFARAQAQEALCRGEFLQESGDLEGAERCFRAADAILVSSDDQAGRAESLLSLGSAARERGDMERAAAYLDEALTTGRTLDRPATRVIAEAARATLPGGDPAAACATAERDIGHATYSCRMRVRFDLWLATKDPRHLEDARRLLDVFLEGLPDERRRRALENFRLHREIVAACARAGLRAPV